MGTYLRTLMACAVIVGTLCGAAMLHVTWLHNPQGEFHEAGTIHWAPWLIHGGAGLAVGLVMGAALSLPMFLVCTLLRGRRSTGSRL